MKNFIKILSFVTFCFIGISINQNMVYANDELTNVKEFEIYHINSLDEINTDDFTWERYDIQIDSNIDYLTPTNGLSRASSEYTKVKNSKYSGVEDNGKIILVVIIDYELWYIDGKVHLYSRSISIGSYEGFKGTLQYGAIKNTDGAYSYTEGDRVILTKTGINWGVGVQFMAFPTSETFYLSWLWQ